MLPADAVLKKSWPEGSQATQFLTITCGWPISEQGEWLGAARASRVLTSPWASEHSFSFPRAFRVSARRNKATLLLWDSPAHMGDWGAGGASS